MQGVHLTSAVLLGVVFSSGFGNALQPIRILALLEPLLALIAFDRLALMPPAWGMARPRLWLAMVCTVMILATALGRTVAFAGTLGYPETTAVTLAASFGFAAALSTATTLFALLGSHLAVNRWPSSLFATLAFPCLNTAAFTFMAIFLSSFLSPGNAVVDDEPMRQMSAVWGVAGAVWYLSVLASVLYVSLWVLRPQLLGRGGVTGATAPLAAARQAQYHQVPTHDHVSLPGAEGSRSDAKGGTVTGMPAVSAVLHQPPAVHLHVVTMLFVVQSTMALLMGGLLAQATLFYQVDITKRLPLTIQADLCPASQWAEESVNISSSPGEADLLQRARQLLAAYGSNSYLGLSYQALHSDVGKYTNHFTLMRPDGEIAWNYLKAYPVPVVEADVMGGPAVLPIHDSPFGRLSGAICFDLDHPHFALQAAQLQVDIMLQPSWTWGSLGPRHFSGNQLRAIEGGYTILRCSTSGVSGVVTPGGMVSTQAFTGESGLEVFTVPLFPRRWTPYVHLGLHYVEWLNLAAAVLLWCVLLVPVSWLQVAATRLDGRGLSGWRPARGSQATSSNLGLAERGGERTWGAAEPSEAADDELLGHRHLSGL